MAASAVGGLATFYALRQGRPADVAVLTGVLVTIAGLGLLTWRARRRWTRDRYRLQAAIDCLGDGLDIPFEVVRGSGLQPLENALAQAAARIRAREGGLRDEVLEQEALVDSMVQGLITVDRRERVMRINRAAVRMFNLREETLVGRPIQEVLRDPDLHNLVAESLAREGRIRKEMELAGPVEQVVAAHASALCDHRNRRIGSILVFQDITRLRQLERMRSEFVANVSHELKTPITSIKGFIETLSEGAAEDPEARARFLGIIAKHSARLESIIEDLLSLSKIEQTGVLPEATLDRVPVRKILEAAVESVEGQARATGVPLTLDVNPPDLPVKVREDLLVQGVANLAENAIKYGGTGNRVEITARSVNGHVVISVTDHGPGIPADHLPRLFERFYRIDRARSREVGGTGLGLSIVKHIAQAHRGEVEVESQLGHGSTFRIRLPAG